MSTLRFFAGFQYPARLILAALVTFFNTLLISPSAIFAAMQNPM